MKYFQRNWRQPSTSRRKNESMFVLFFSFFFSCCSYSRSQMKTSRSLHRQFMPLGAESFSFFFFFLHSCQSQWCVKFQRLCWWRCLQKHQTYRRVELSDKCFCSSPSGVKLWNLCSTKSYLIVTDFTAAHWNYTEPQKVKLSRTQPRQTGPTVGKIF